VAADATAEIENMPRRKLLLQAQGVGDVVGAAQMPRRQLQQMARTDGVFVKLTGLIGVKGAGSDAAPAQRG
jgi:hypothetical protein